MLVAVGFAADEDDVAARTWWPLRRSWSCVCSRLLCCGGRIAREVRAESRCGDGVAVVQQTCAAGVRWSAWAGVCLRVQAGGCAVWTSARDLRRERSSSRQGRVAGLGVVLYGVGSLKQAAAAAAVGSSADPVRIGSRALDSSLKHTQRAHKKALHQ